MAIAEIERKYLTEKEASAFLGYRPTSLRQSRWTGILSGHPAPKAVRFGRNVRYEIPELERWASMASGGVTK